MQQYRKVFMEQLSLKYETKKWEYLKEGKAVISIRKSCMMRRLKCQVLPVLGGEKKNHPKELWKLYVLTYFFRCHENEKSAVDGMPGNIASVFVWWLFF